MIGFIHTCVRLVCLACLVGAVACLASGWCESDSTRFSLWCCAAANGFALLVGGRGGGE